LEDTRDVALVDEFYERLGRGEAELVPSEVVDRLLAGETPVRVWRQFRGLTQQALADGAGISKNYLSQIETGQRDGRVRVLQALAKELGVDLDDLVDQP
ncbi:MAG: helix-turn-helix transcriptional regulator, partial [Nitrococcus sp.]|nr:helix-turn-helix transcriptional regulator [Nitrococcus sp.]